MDSVLIKVLATAAWILISSIFGFLLGRKEHRYGVWKPIVHAACFVFIAAGAAFSLMHIARAVDVMISDGPQYKDLLEEPSGREEKTS
jgi:hypothetical protein